MENEEKEVPAVNAGGADQDTAEPSAPVQAAAGDVSESQAISSQQDVDPAVVPDTAMRMEDDFPQLKQPALKAKTSRGKKLLAATVGFIVLASGAAASYMYYQKTKQQPAAPDKGAIVRSAIEAMRGVKAYDYDGKASFSLDAKEKDDQGQENVGRIGFDLSSKGTADFRNQDAPRLYTALAMDGNFELSEDAKKGDGRLDAEFAYLDKTFYVKLNDVRLNDGTEYPSEMIKQMEGAWEIIRGNWYFISQEGLDGMSGDAVAASEDSAEDGPITQEEMAKINGIISGYDLIKFDRDLGDERVGSVDAYHFKVMLDGREGVDLVMELAKEGLLMQGNTDAARNLEEELEQKAEDVEKAKELIDLVLNKVNAEIWIGKNDNLIYRFKIDGNFDNAFRDAFIAKYRELYQDQSEEDQADLEDMELNFNLDYTLSNFNSVEVLQPENAKDLMKIIAGIQAQAVENSYPSVDTDQDGLSDAQESFYGSDPKKADTDGDGYLDGNEVENGYDPIVPGSAKIDYAKLYNL